MVPPGILLIEGEEDGLTARVLRKYRIDNLVERTADGQGAIELLRAGFASRIQLLVLDHSLPGIPALETVARARAFRGLEELPVVVLCGSQEEERQVRAWGLPRTTCMSKPAGFFKLLECIQKLEMRWWVFAAKPG